MADIIIIEKNGNIKQTICKDINNLYKSCGFRKSEGFERRHTWENLIIACSPCNSKKGNKTPMEAEMKLMKVPKKPNRFMYYNQYISHKNEGWREYLFQNKN